MRVPKDVRKYLPSYVAGIRLIDLALQHILCRPGVRIKWELKLYLYYPPEVLAKSKAVAIPTWSTFGSGDFEEKPAGEPAGKPAGKPEKGEAA